MSKTIIYQPKAISIKIYFPPQPKIKEQPKLKIFAPVGSKIKSTQ